MLQTKMSSKRWKVAVTGLAAMGVLAAVQPVAASAKPPSHAPAGQSLSVEVLSSRPDTVSGGDALISIDVPRNVSPKQLRITLDGRDVRQAFRAGGDSRTLVGLVDSLALGDNELVVSPNGRGHGRPDPVAVTLVNHPDEGPVFSGEQNPMYCTAGGAPWNLGPVDEDCHVAAPTVTYRYRTTAGAFATYPTDGSVPADLATTTTTEGHQIPYVVRVERGTLNRAVYETAVLHQPATPAPDPWTDTAGWNGKLVYTFGGACGVGYWQGTSTGGVENDLLLRQGYGVASSTLNVFAQNCDDVTSAETAMMVKEHFIESYGADQFTMGFGGSAGTMQQLLLSNNYPGILDGVVGEIGYPDERTTTVNGHDCRGLTSYWNTTTVPWTDEQKRAVMGFAVTQTCNGFMFFDGVDDPNRGCNPAIPVADRWNATTNPDGLRCTIADQVSNVYGVDENGYGRRVVPDNVGVQYGLQALESGAITVDQFLSLNAGVGGVDINGNRTAERSAADPLALERAYATGRVNQFTGGLRYIPVIEVRGYRDPAGDFHDRIRSWSIRERQLRANGDAGTHVSWTGAPGDSGQMIADALDGMDRWLTAIDQAPAAASDASRRDTAVAARPQDLQDGCYQDGIRITEKVDYEASNTCNDLYPFHADPRVIAGASPAKDVLKCQVRSPQRSDYGDVRFSDAQWQQLLATFPGGVCDWSRPGVGQVPLQGTWLTF
ncbi:DUF6351 family protein [Modestobacter sp. SYSU DS0875]